MPIPRKILVRVIGAPLLLAALGGVLYWGYRQEQRGQENFPLQVLLLGVALVLAYELRAMARAKGLEIHGVLAPAVLLLFLFWYRRGPDPLPVFAAAATALVLFLACDWVFRFDRVRPEGLGLTLFAFLYIALLGFLLYPPVPRSVASAHLLFLLACSKGSDMAAFVVGKSIGKRKMAPVVSPNKTWEGGIGGGVAGTAAGFAVLGWTPLGGAFAGVPLPALLALCLSVTIAAQVGDLVKSAFKRWAGVKDSGRLLPEFGGMLDMVDSFLVAGPVAHFGVLAVHSIWKG
jgi:CDP-diglyceride synthetase